MPAISFGIDPCRAVALCYNECVEPKSKFPSNQRLADKHEDWNTMDEMESGRDRTGRFAKGNQGGPGRPRGSGNALRRAAEEAVTPEHVAAIIRRAGGGSW